MRDIGDTQPVDFDGLGTHLCIRPNDDLEPLACHDPAATDLNGGDSDDLVGAGIEPRCLAIDGDHFIWGAWFENEAV